MGAACLVVRSAEKRMTTKLFLDLEDTIITVWHDPVLINVQKIRKWMDSQVDLNRNIIIWSFAIWNAKDEDHFRDSGMKSMIEQALDVNIILWPSVDVMASINTKFTSLRWEDRTDFMQLKGKHDSFRDWCRLNETNCRCVLLDDAVPNETLIVHNKSLILDLINVDIL
jgi:hypothetical protein